MYLSRVEIDRLNRKKTRDLTHLGAYHHWVEKSFPEEIEAGRRTRKLWRIDRIGNKEYLLIVSSVKPNRQALERYGVPGTGEVKEYSGFLASIKEGQHYRFRLQLNPVVSLSQGSGKRGRVVPHVTADQQKAYLLNRAEKNGFSLEEGSFDLVDRTYLPLKKAGERELRLSSATYEGELVVTDLEQFYRTLTEGMGKKKAYGFGMMTIIPLVNHE